MLGTRVFSGQGAYGRESVFISRRSSLDGEGISMSIRSQEGKDGLRWSTRLSALEGTPEKGRLAGSVSYLPSLKVRAFVVDQGCCCCLTANVHRTCYAPFVGKDLKPLRRRTCCLYCEFPHLLTFPVLRSFKRTAKNPDVRAPKFRRTSKRSYRILSVLSAPKSLLGRLCRSTRVCLALSRESIKFPA